MDLSLARILKWIREYQPCIDVTSSRQAPKPPWWVPPRPSPRAPAWPPPALPKRLLRVIDEYGLDGIYIDSGYIPNARPGKAQMPLAKDHVSAFEETPEHDAAHTDLLALVHAEVKRRGGIFKLHMSGAEEPKTAGQKVYDYLWVGENVGNADGLREAAKNYPPYVVPCMDVNLAKVHNEDEPYLHAIPYMQFPLHHAGRPFIPVRCRR